MSDIRSLSTIPYEYGRATGVDALQVCDGPLLARNKRTSPTKLPLGMLETASSPQPSPPKGGEGADFSEMLLHRRRQRKSD